jgi:alcohol dehydrogenase
MPKLSQTLWVPLQVNDERSSESFRQLLLVAARVSLAVTPAGLVCASTSLEKNMKTTAAVLDSMGKPSPYGEFLPLAVEELELEGPSDGEVLVEIKAAGLCHSDLSVIDGSRPRVMPMVLGHEAAGIVREVGPGVCSFKPDDHVVFSFVPICGICKYCLSGRSTLCENGAAANLAGSLLTGGRRFRRKNGQLLHHHLGVSGFSQYTVAAHQSLITIDSALPFNNAALFGCAALTGAGAVINSAKVAPGESIAVFGLGGVGLSAVMAAKAVGAYPIIAVDRKADKLLLASRVGASHTIDASETDPVAAIREITAGGANVTIEAVGNEQVCLQSYEATSRGGRTVCVGLPDSSKKFSIPIVNLVAEERAIVGSYMGSSIPGRDIPKFIAMYQGGILPVDEIQSGTINIQDINTAFDKLARGEAVRQILVF